MLFYLIDVNLFCPKGTKKCVIRRKLEFEDHKNHFEVTHCENKINYLEKNEIDVDIFKEGHKEFIKINKLKLKAQLSDCNWTRTQNHLVLKRTLSHLAKLAK